MIDRRALLAGAGAGAALAAMPGQAASQRKPNILFIMADDLGWADIGCYGRDDVRTPAIDGLAAAGLRFTDAYANSSVCSPTRVGLITGRYQYRLPVGQDEPLGESDVGLEPGTPTLPGLLKRAGYRTALVGKWHMGTPLRFSPLANGYDRFWGLRGGGIDYFTHDLRMKLPGRASASKPDLWDGDVPVEQAGYLTDLIADHAIAEIERMAPGPFLLSLHFTAPHWPWEGPGDSALRVDNVLHFDGGTIATYRAMVESLDRNIGRVLAALEAAGLAQDTIVIFTSDNGGERFSKTWPFNGMKGELLEGGIRTPLIVRWPGRVPAGAVTGQMGISMDWLPTLLAAAGASPDPSAPPDGMSLLPVLARPENPIERTLFWRFKAHAQAAARRGRWKYLRIDGTDYLFDVTADPQERANRKDAEPQRFAELKSAWEAWNATMPPYPEGSASWSNKALRTLPDRY